MRGIRKQFQIRVGRGFYVKTNKVTFEYLDRLERWQNEI